jgi:exosortase
MLGLATPALIGGLLYVRRDLLAKLRDGDGRGHVQGILLLGFATVVAVVALAAHALPVLALTGAMSVHGYLLWTRGHERTKGLLLPIYLLVLLVPVSEPQLALISTTIQQASAHGAGAALTLVGFDVVVDGITVVAEGTRNRVTEACSGLATVLTLLVYAAAFSYVTKLGWRRGLAVAATLVPFALGANVLRIALVSYVLVTYGEETARGPLHDLSGYGAFLLSYVALFGMVAVLKRRPSVASGQLGEPSRRNASRWSRSSG